MEQARLSSVEARDIPELAAREVARAVTEAVALRGIASLALSGGTTPRAMHEVLARFHELPWEKIHVYFGDERCVPPDHPDSNYRMAKDSLFDRGRASTGGRAS
jgi:6-phosphogluconolactonase